MHPNGLTPAWSTEQSTQFHLRLVIDGNQKTVSHYIKMAYGYSSPSHPPGEPLPHRQRLLARQEVTTRTGSRVHPLDHLDFALFDTGSGRNC